MFFKRLLTLFLLAGLAGAAPDGDWENLPDGSMGQITEFHGVDGLAIPAYIRKPPGP